MIKYFYKFIHTCYNWFMDYKEFNDKENELKYENQKLTEQNKNLDKIIKSVIFAM